jgi:SAM-dependent methyltransferase
MSGSANYADRLAKKIGYTNTFLHKEPRLDIMNPGEDQLNRYDFVISSDVLEHVPPPVALAFSNTLKLLSPNGVFVLTVPYTKEGATLEHFPDLHSYKLEPKDGKKILRNVTKDGRTQEFDRLIFHGGEGETLEMRVFSEQGVLNELRKAGFTDIQIHREPHAVFGILWPQDWSLPISARRPITVLSP